MKFGKTSASENTHHDLENQRKFFDSLNWVVWAPGLRPEKIQIVISFGVITVILYKKEIPAEK